MIAAARNAIQRGQPSMATTMRRRTSKIKNAVRNSFILAPPYVIISFVSINVIDTQTKTPYPLAKRLGDNNGREGKSGKGGKGFRGHNPDEN